jgi:hypothetical protein
MTLIELVTSLKALAKGIRLYDEISQRSGDKHEEALRAIYFAATETEGYLSEIGISGRNHPKEISLSHLWVQAGIQLRKIDPGLAERCIRKAEYWGDPDSWTEQEIREAKITLRMMRDDARTLLFK